MVTPNHSPSHSTALRRRSVLGMGVGLAGAVAGGWIASGGASWAQQVEDFVSGPPVADLPARQISPHVWMIYATDGFPTPENKGMMSNITFVITQAGVVILDSGSSLQIGQMAIRVIRKITPLPVVAVFNSHYHGDHWLGNHAFVEAFGPQLPIYALAHTQKMIQGIEGSTWRSLMERWTNQATVGTKVMAPNRVVENGQVITLGGLHFAMHHYGTAHTAGDLCVQVVEDGVTAVGDIAMGNRIANIDEGSYPGTFAYFKMISAKAPDQMWIPGHGEPAKDLLQKYGDFLAGIWEPCVRAVKEGAPETTAKSYVLADPRVARRADSMQGFASNIGKYVSLAYLEAEKSEF